MNTLEEAAKSLEAPEERHIYTYDELAAGMPETTQPHELWDGKLIFRPSPLCSHQEIY